MENITTVTKTCSKELLMTSNYSILRTFEVWTNAFKIRVSSKIKCNKGNARDDSSSCCSMLKFRVFGRCRRSGDFEAGFILAGHKQFLNLFQRLVLRLW